MAKAPQQKQPETRPGPNPDHKPAETKSQGNKKTPAKEIPALFVRSRPTSFHRAGHKFTHQGHGIALDALTEEQVAAIKAEPMLIVEECTIDSADVQGTEDE